MYTVMSQLKIAFLYLAKKQFKEFAKELYSVICLMAIMHIISYETVEEIKKELYLDEQEVCMESNPDGTYTTYCGQKPLNTFRLNEMYIWILKELIEDELMSQKLYTKNVQDFFAKLKSIQIPMGWSDIHDKIGSKWLYPVLANNYIYYLEKTSWNSLSLKRVENALKSIPVLDDAELIQCGVEEKLMYLEVTKSVYCRLEGINAYVHYDTERKEGKTVVSQAKLIGIGRDGTEWYRDDEQVLCSYSEGILKRHKNASGGMELQGKVLPILQEKYKKRLRGNIGSFTEDEGKLLVRFDSVTNGQIDDRFITLNVEQRYEGEVYYDLEKQMFMATWKSPREFNCVNKIEALVGDEVLFFEEEQNPETEEVTEEDDVDIPWDAMSELLDGIDLEDLPF